MGCSPYTKWLKELQNNYYEEDEFEDGEEAELSANAIAQSMYAQCDPEGNQYLMFDSIVDFRRCTTALEYAHQIVKRADGRTFMRRCTRGWQFCVMFKDGSTQWIKLSALKASHQLECADCAVSQNLQLEPAFNWWVNATLKQRERIIKQVKTRKAARYLMKNEISVGLSN